MTICHLLHIFSILFFLVKFIDFDCDFTISYIDSTNVVE